MGREGMARTEWEGMEGIEGTERDGSIEKKLERIVRDENGWEIPIRRDGKGFEGMSHEKEWERMEWTGMDYKGW